MGRHNHRMTMARTTSLSRPWSQTSWWVVVVGGLITIFFMFAIGREIFRTATVRRQVSRLQTELAKEDQRQSALQDLIGYLSSPTFQEREARLKLGLKKNGERVIVIPDSTNTNQTSTNDQSGQATSASSIPQRWWKYFFGPQSS